MAPSKRTEPEKPEPIPAGVHTLPSIVLPTGVPLIICTDEDLDADVVTKQLLAEFPDQSVFYLLASAEKYDETRLYRLVQNQVGWAIAETKLEKTNWMLPKLKEAAFFRLPALPAVLTDKVDQFFRLVDHDLGTEAIVLLTFDPASEGSSDGWGVVVPDQTNTSGHCSYDQTSVVADLPEGVRVVGSIHSHPGMSAFASGTDHSDQADFEGLHLTFGYPAYKQRATEVSAELQLAGKNWNIKNEYVMEVVTEVEVSEELKSWRAKVTKKPPAVGSSSGPTGTGGGATSKSLTGRRTPREINATRPASCPDITDAAVIVRVLDGEGACPVCGNSIIGYDATHRKCGHCLVYWAYAGETRRDLVEIRAKADQYSIHTIELDLADGAHPHGAHPYKDIWLWERWRVVEQGHERVIGQAKRLWDAKVKVCYDSDDADFLGTEPGPSEEDTRPFA